MIFHTKGTEKIEPVARPGRHPTRGNRRFSMPLHRPLWMRSKNTEEYVDLAIEKVVQVHTENLSRTGDILLFLPGKEEV